MEKAFYALISGRVQGVNFRSFTRKNAKALGLRGYVKNLEDGEVEVEAEGEEEKLKELLELIKKGPRMANVRDFEVEWKEPEGFNDFKVEY